MKKLLKNPDLIVRIYSFGFQKSGVPPDTTDNKGGFVFDCRLLPNPGREKVYKLLSGRDQEVIKYLERHIDVERFLKSVFEIIDAAIENYQERKFSNLMVSFGCTGGQHRSVYCAEQLTKHLRNRNIAIQLHHEELDIHKSFNTL